jgi:AraC family transcriptional regulator
MRPQRESILTEELPLGALVLVISDYPPGFTQPVHAHAETSRAFLLRGDFEESARGRSWRASVGDELVKPAGLEHADRFGPEGARLVALRWAAAPQQAPRACAYEWRHDLRRLGLVVALARDSRARRDEPLALEERALDLFAGAPEAGDRPPRPPRCSAAPAWLEVVKGRLADDPTLSSVRSLALEAGVHPVHLARVFRRVTGATLREWRRRLRVERALRLLQSGDPSLAAAALAAGFSDHSHLCRAFRRELGIPPSELAGLWGRQPRSRPRVDRSADRSSA